MDSGSRPGTVYSVYVINLATCVIGFVTLLGHNQEYLSVACDLAPGRSAVGLQEMILRNCPEHSDNRKTQAEFRISADTDTTTLVICNDYKNPTHYSFTPVLNSSAQDRPSLPKRVIDLPVYCGSVTVLSYEK